MPLVFVHGVKTRKSPTYEKEKNARNKFFTRYTFRNILREGEKPYNPYWGDKGAFFHWNHDSVPQKEEPQEEFGLLEDDEILVLLEAILGDRDISQGKNILLEVTQQTSLENVIDLIWAASLTCIPEDQTDEWIDLAIKAIDYAQHNSHPDWLNEVENNYQFLFRLQKAVNNWNLSSLDQSQEETPQLETFGSLNTLWSGGIKEGVEKIHRKVDRISESASRTGDFGGYQVGHQLVQNYRLSAHPFVSEFVGDVCVYIKRKQLIVDAIVPKLQKAREEANISGNKLIVVAHSMGGNIMYDILTHFQPDLKIDLLVTVGSQVAWFEELKLFEVSDWAISANAPVNKVPKPNNIKYWFNVYDPNDVFSFRVEPVFNSFSAEKNRQEVYDFEYSTGKGVISAHTTYFSRASFYDCLTKRIENLNLWQHDNDSDS